MDILEWFSSTLVGLRHFQTYRNDTPALGRRGLDNLTPAELGIVFTVCRARRRISLPPVSVRSRSVNQQEQWKWVGREGNCPLKIPMSGASRFSIGTCKAGVTV